jgi:GT2 family glycosyltransferase
MNRTAVIIPHHSGGDLLCRCLVSLGRSTDRGFDVVLVDNGSTDGSVGEAKRRFPRIRVVRSQANLGFAGGCNLGIRSTDHPYVLLLNDDAQVHPGWFGPLKGKMESDRTIAAVQPKMLSIQDPGRFDYCGAAGGEMDVFGYPFARGRLFETIEFDVGQYDGPANAPSDVFWATGAAVLLRRSALIRVGLLDESFFAHMEEIDLDFRLHWAGYRIACEPGSVVYHRTGGTLGQESYKKMMLNHRNSLLMLLKNHTVPALCWLLPARLFLEALTFVSALFAGRWKRAAAVPAGLTGVLTHWKAVIRGRQRVASIRTQPEGRLLHQLYRGSAALKYYLLGVRTADILLKRKNS